MSPAAGRLPAFPAFFSTLVSAARSLVVASGAAWAQAPVPAAPVASAASGEPLHSPACRKALDSLDVQEQRSASAAAAASSSLESLRLARRRAALACLGQPDAPLPQHVATPPVRVAPVTVPLVPVPVPKPVPPAVATPAPPPTVTSCDPAGCWASDGTRLLRNGPDLVGPRGLCSVVGSVLRCP